MSVNYYGVHVPGWLDNLAALNSFESDAQKAVAIVMWYQGWGVTDGTQNFMTTWMNNVRNHGSIPMVTWEPWLYTDGVNQPTYALQNIINGNFDVYITKWAQDSKSWGYPYFLRLAQEPNGNWYPWDEGVNGNPTTPTPPPPSGGKFVQAWQHVHDIFTAQNVPNVTWVWAPNAPSAAGASSVANLYPGNSYVDWIGIDGYNFGTWGGHGWRTFTDRFSSLYNSLIGYGKPLMIAEMASSEVGGDKAAWITDAYTTEILNNPNFSQINAVIWFNEQKEEDWRIESSSSATQAFAQAVASSQYKSNQYGSLTTSPIPSPN